MPPIDGIESGLLPRQMMPTPTSQDHIERKSTSTEKLNPLTGKSVTLDRFVKFWPDPETQESGRPKLWPTPAARDYRDCAAPAEYERNTPTTASIVGGSLNPQFVEWLMGYPMDWTVIEEELQKESQAAMPALKPSETQ